MISVKDLTYGYPKTKVKVLKNVSLEINTGEFWGLIGPNGAGKTTMLSLLSGYLNNFKGAIFVNGKTFLKDSKLLKKQIGIVPQEYALYENLTARENLMFFGAMFDIKKQKLVQCIDEGLKRIEMLEHADRKIKHYSGGMKRRINLLTGTLHNPAILFLDEPTVGVDIQSKDIIINYLKEINKKGTTVIYTSHHMSEAQSLCSKIAFINNGKIIANKTPLEYLQMFPETSNLEEVYHKINR